MRRCVSHFIILIMLTAVLANVTSALSASTPIPIPEPTITITPILAPSPTLNLTPIPIPVTPVPIPISKPANLTGYFNDYGEDSDGNGLYDHLVVEVGVNVNLAGKYLLSGYLYENGTSNEVDYAYTPIYLDEGVHVVKLGFDGGKIRDSNFNGTYDLRNVKLCKAKGMLVSDPVDSVEYACTTSYYNHTEFDPPEPPVASFMYTPKNPMVNEVIEFNASLSYDPDGCITSYTWLLEDFFGIIGSPVVTHSYSSPGCYRVSLFVGDNDDLTNTTSKYVAVGCGDVTGDGLVNESDIMAILHHVGYGSEISNEWAADVNGDGSINMGDVIKLLYHVGYGEELECICSFLRLI